jgi:hypothetical protein
MFKASSTPRSTQKFWFKMSDGLLRQHCSALTFSSASINLPTTMQVPQYLLNTPAQLNMKHAKFPIQNIYSP